MKKYKCPYCEHNSFSLLKKMFTGGMTSKGTACPECGKHAVHGVKATVFNTIVMTAAFIFILINFNSRFEICLCVLAGAWVLCRIVNGLFFELSENIRRDVL